MKCYSVIVSFSVLLLAVSSAAAQDTPAPRIPYADLPTPAEIMAEYADDPVVVADAKRFAILDDVRGALKDMYPRESVNGDPEWKRVSQSYSIAADAISERYGDNREFDRERRKYTFGFYMDENREEAGHTDLKAFRLEFFDRHMPAYAEWSRAQSAAWDQKKFNAKLNNIFGALGGSTGWLGIGLVLLVFVLAALGIPRGTVRLSKDGQTIFFGGTPFSVNNLTGQVLDARKDITQEVSGGGGSGHIVDGRGSITIDPVVTTTTITDTLFLKDEEGLEHSIRLHDFDIVARPGNLVTVQQFARRGQQEGWLGHAYNHSTREAFLQNDVIKVLMRPSWFWLLLTILGWVIAWNLLSLLPSEGGLDFGGTIIFILVAATWLEFFRRSVASLRFRRFRKGRAYQRLLEDVAQESLAPQSIGVA